MAIIESMVVGKGKNIKTGKFETSEKLGLRTEDHSGGGRGAVGEKGGFEVGKGKVGGLSKVGDLKKRVERVLGL